MGNKRTLAPSVVAAAVLAAVAVGCGGEAGGPDPAASSGSPSGDYEIRGTVVAVMRHGASSRSTRGDPGVMAAMTMPYEVADAGLLPGSGPATACAARSASTAAAT